MRPCPGQPPCRCHLRSHSGTCIGNRRQELGLQCFKPGAFPMRSILRSIAGTLTYHGFSLCNPTAFGTFAAALPACCMLVHVASTIPPQSLGGSVMYRSCQPVPFANRSHHCLYPYAPLCCSAAPLPPNPPAVWLLLVLALQAASTEVALLRAVGQWQRHQAVSSLWLQVNKLSPEAAAAATGAAAAQQQERQQQRQQHSVNACCMCVAVGCPVFKAYV